MTREANSVTSEANYPLQRDTGARAASRDKSAPMTGLAGKVEAHLEKKPIIWGARAVSDCEDNAANLFPARPLSH